MPSTQVECAVSEPDIQSVEKLFVCKEATLELEDVWLESVHKCTEDSTIEGAQVECTACDDSTEDAKVDSKSMEFLFYSCT